MGVAAVQRCGGAGPPTDLSWLQPLTAKVRVLDDAVHAHHETMAKGDVDERGVIADLVERITVKPGRGKVEERIEIVWSDGTVHVPVTDEPLLTPEEVIERA